MWKELCSYFGVITKNKYFARKTFDAFDCKAAKGINALSNIGMLETDFGPFLHLTNFAIVSLGDIVIAKKTKKSLKKQIPLIFLKEEKSQS